MFLTDVPNKREANGTVSFPVRLWDLSSGREIRTFTGHSSFVKAVAISPDGKFILTGSEDKTARLWDVASGSSLHTFPGNSFILDVAFSPNGKYALIDNGDGKVKLWDLASKNALHVFNGQFVAFSPDSKYALTGSYDKTAKLWDITSGRLIKTFSEHEGPVKAVAFSPDGKYILTGSDDKTAKLWAVTSERSLQTFVGRVSGVTCAAMAPDGKTILAGYSDEKLKQWDLFDRALKTLSSKTGYLTSLTFSPDSKFILTGSGNSAKLSDFSGSAQQTFTGHAGEINTVAISSDGQYILTGSWDNTAKLWDRSGNILQTLTGHTGIVLSVAISPNGQYLLTGSEDKTAKLWDRASGRMLKTLNGKYNGSVETVAFSPDGKMALTPGGFENTLKLWEIPSGREIKTLSPSHKRKIMSAAFSPDGKYVLTGSTDNTAKLYDVSTGREIKTFADNGSFFRVAFSPDGKYVLTSGLDKIVKLWDVNTGEKLASLISFNTDDDWVVTTPSGLFDASPGAMKGMHFMVGLEVVTLEQLKKRYYEPGLLAKVLGLAPGGLRPVAELNKVELYPEITSATIENDRLQVQLQERNGGIGKVALLLDGNIELEANVNPDFNAAFEVDLNRFAGYFIDEGINHLSLLTYNSKGWLTGESYPLDYRPSGVRDRGGNTPLTKANAKKDVQLESINFYALVVGTSVYSGGTLTLKYPDKDATAFAEALRLTGGKLFGNNIEVNLLTTSAEPWPRKAEIAKALREIAAKADPNDILLVYLSGHGITYPPNSEKGQFYYLTTDIMDDKLDDSDLLNAQAIAQDTLQEWIRQVKARKRILILDACNSGKVVESLNPGEKALNSDQRRALERMKDRSGMFVLAGSAADKSSFEASRFGHGLLTYSLLNNMPLVAASNKTYIDVGKLFGNTLEEVPRLAEDIGKVQKPELIGAGSFDIGIIDKATIFKTPQTIPVFLRTNFMDGQKFKDLQYLSKAVNDELNKRASFKKPGLAFWDIAEYTGEHYYLGGQYRTNGETIEGKATMYRKDKELAQFPFSGPASDLKALADEIVNQAFDHYNQEIENKQKKE